MYTKKLTRLLDSDLIEKGQIDGYTKLLLETLIKTIHLHDASIWLAIDDEHIGCVGYQATKDDEEMSFTSISSGSFIEFNQQLNSNTLLTYTFANAEAAVWLGDIDVTHFRTTLIPIKIHGRNSGFVMLRQKPHQAAIDSTTIQFVISSLFALSTTINNYHRASSLNNPTQREILLEQSVREHNEGLKEMLQNLEKSQSYQVEVEKMEALGELVAGVAHEVNTPLGVAMTSVSVIEEQVKKLESAYHSQKLDEKLFVEFLDTVLPAMSMTNTNLERAALLVQQFKQTSDNEGHGASQIVDFKPLCENLIESISPIYQPFDVEFTVDVPTELQLETIPGAIEQILTNLINNSCQHGFRDTQQPHNLVFIKVFQVEDKIIVDYQDNGIGIKDSVAGQVFTPFYTTNRNKGGTGLGLSIVYNLVTQKLQGDIRIVEQNASVGAHFQIRLPLSLVR